MDEFPVVSDELIKRLNELFPIRDDFGPEFPRTP